MTVLAAYDLTLPSGLHHWVVASLANQSGQQGTYRGTNRVLRNSLSKA